MIIIIVLIVLVTIIYLLNTNEKITSNYKSDFKINNMLIKKTNDTCGSFVYDRYPYITYYRPIWNRFDRLRY